MYDTDHFLMLHWPRYVKWVLFVFLILFYFAGNACPISCLEREPEILGERHSRLLFSVSSQELGFSSAATAAAKSLQSCPTLCDPIDGSPPGSPIPGILQARKLEWVAISFSNAWKRKVKVKLLSHVQLLATPWTEAYQAPPSMGFSRQEYWSGLPLPSPGI